MKEAKAGSKKSPQRSLQSKCSVRKTADEDRRSRRKKSIERIERMRNNRRRRLQLPSSGVDRATRLTGDSRQSRRVWRTKGSRHQARR